MEHVGTTLIRPAEPEDAPGIAKILGRRFARYPELLPGRRLPANEDVLQWLQTGNELLVAECGSDTVGTVRRWLDEGVYWLDLLTATRAGAGRELARAVEHGAQDRGIRFVRLKAPDLGALPVLFGRWGYLPVSRLSPEEAELPYPLLVMEKRVPLLTVREQRREDAPALAALTGQDEWWLSLRAQPGWFAVADGDELVGAIWLEDDQAGTARIVQPVLLASHRGRGLELWMVDRAALYAQTHGYHSAELEATAEIDEFRRALEERGWYREDLGDGAKYLRRF